MRYIIIITILFIFWMFIQDIYISILQLVYVLYNLNKRSRIYIPKMKALKWDKWAQYKTSMKTGEWSV